MSAKWRALQHRHRYTYSAIVFPPSFLSSLPSLLPHPPCSHFHSALLHFTTLSSTFSQLNHSKHVATSFSNLLLLPPTDPQAEPAILEASKIYLSLLFLENSAPLHRTLVSVLVKAKTWIPQIGQCFQKLCEDYAAGGSGKGSRFTVSRAALSVMGMPKLGYLVDVVEECAVVVARDVVCGLGGVVHETNDGKARPSPIVMEQCQESLSCLYYLLQKFPSKFRELSGDGSCMVLEGCEGVMEGIVTVLLSVLSSSAFSRDCFVAAGVALCAALQVCVNSQDLGLLLIQGIFNLKTSNSGVDCNSRLRNAVQKVPFKGDFYSGICSLSVLSRLCLIRGILTAVSRNLLNTHFTAVVDCEVQSGGGRNINTILYDGILPELCKYCENPVDSHFNFHALTVMQICLQQIKTSILSNLTDMLGNYDPIPEEMGMRILRIIWNNLEDPLSQTVKQVHLIFDLFLDIQSSLCWSESSEKMNSFLRKIALDLLLLGSRCKGRYVPLALLTKRLGAKKMLDMNPDLLFETIQAYVDDDVCCAATSFLKCFLEFLRDECWETDGIEGGYALYREHCLPPILYGLASGFSKLRSNLNTYALPVLLEVDVDSIFPMLSFISVGPTGDENGLQHPELVGANMELNQRIAILVSLLKVSRSLALVEGDIDWCENPAADETEGPETKKHALVCIKGINVMILAQWFVNALTHVDESLRVDAAESLFLNPKMASLPSHLELTLMKEAVPLNMRCCSTAFQMKWSSLFRKFFSRVRTALERQLKQGSWNPLEHNKFNEVCPSNGNKEVTIKRADDLFHFMRWLSGFLFFSCYPSAPYKRKIMAMDLMLIMLNVWSINPSVGEESNNSSSGNHLYPYSKEMTSSDSTLLLVGSVIDSWDRLRENSFRILLHFPTPLPGISGEDMLKKVIAWAMKLVCSPRVRESDAGALAIRLIFRKYVLELGWLIQGSFNVIHLTSNSELVNEANQISKFRNPVIIYMTSMIDWLDAAVKDGEQDLSKACKNSFVHGILLALRYIFEELDWNSDLASSSISGMRYLLERLLELVMRITSLALWVVSADAWYLPEDMDDMDDMGDDDSLLLEIPDHEHEHVPPSEYENNNSKPFHAARSSEQIVMVGCWLAMKEVSLLLGTIIRKVPLPSHSSSDSSELDWPSVDTAGFSSDCVLDVEQLETIGNHFLEVLLKMKHNGAIDKTRAGFTALCNRLLCSNDPRLCRLTESWMEQLMQRTVAKGQVVDDLLRRSAGIPAAFIALFLSEPEGAPKKLLPRVLRWLLDVGSGSMLNQIETDSLNGDPCKSNGSMDKNKSAHIAERNVSQVSSKIRDVGVIPTVHAFNVLRAAFNDTNLATDTSGFAAEALILSVRSFSSPYWEIRNSACLAYTALMRRMIGFLNVHKRESARRAITGLEFFHRYPSLHSFVFNELEVATEFLDHASLGDLESNRGNNLHPSLCPILILLSRLKPSSIAGEKGDELDPFLFMPWIRRCSTQSDLRVRVLASRALTCLVSNEKLSSVLLSIASDLPCVVNPDKSATFPIISCANNGSYRISFNLIHGILLQLSSLLDINCRNLADNSKKDRVIGELIQILIPRSWIGRPTHCPCPIVNETFLKVLDQMLSIARTCQMTKHFYPIRNLLLELSAECLDLEPNGLSYYDPTIAALRKQAAISYFSCLFQVSNNEEEAFHLPLRHSLPRSKSLHKHEMENGSPGLLDRLISCLSDSSYEVRHATLKWLLKFLKAADSGGNAYDLSSDEIRVVQVWAESKLHETLVKILASEKNHKCSYYILRILVAWNLQQFEKANHDKCSSTSYVGEMGFDSVFQFWNELVSLYKQTRHAKTQENIVCCLGVCAKRITMLFASSVLFNEGMEKLGCGYIDQEEMFGWLFECIVFFCNMIKQCSSSSEPASMRKAAAESLIASGLLEQAAAVGSFVFNNHIPSGTSSSGFVKNEAANLYARQVLDAWYTCIKLLEDEDDSVRLRLSSDVQKCFRSESLRSNSPPGLVPTQVDRVIRLSFDHLSSIFGPWIYYFDYLCQWVLDAGSYVKSEGDLVRRVFDKEIDNFYEEKLLVSQFCCSNIEKLPILKSWADKDEFRSYLHGWRMRFCHQLMSYAEDQLGKEEGNDWIGGVGNHKDAFLPLYTNLLGFYALSKCIFLVSGNNDAENLLSDVDMLGRAINPFLSNPLISNLYGLVLKSQQKFTSEVSDRIFPEMRDDSIWESFNSYFLLG